MPCDHFVSCLERRLHLQTPALISYALRLYIALLLSMTLFIDFMPSFLGAYSDQRVLLSLALIAQISIGVVWLSLKGEVVPALFELSLFLPLLLSFLVSPLATGYTPFYLVEPFHYLLYFLAFGISGYVISVCGSGVGVAQALALTAIVACFFYAAMTLTVYMFAVTDDFSRLDHVIPWGFVNIRYWSHIATWLVPLFPLCILLGPCKDSRLWRLGVTSTAAVWWWVLFMSASRGSMVGLLIGFFLVWAGFGRTALPWVKLFIRFAIYGLIAWGVLSVVIPSLVFDDLQIRGLKGDSSGRIPLWREAWAMSLQRFPLGMGPQSWLTHETLTDAYRDSSKLGHPHNMYLMWAAEYGWISIGGLLVLGSAALRRLWLRISAIRVGDANDGLLLTAFTASVTAGLVHAGVSAVFIAPGSMLIGLLVLSVFWALISPASLPLAVPSKGAQSPTSIYVGCFIVIVFVGVSSLWFREMMRYQKAMTADIPHYSEEVSQGMLPRFWFHGNFPRPLSQMPHKK